MNTYILLLRGINVGGRNALPMKELLAVLAELGCRNAKTYIQSGNVVFQSSAKVASAIPGKVGLQIQKLRGFKPHALQLPLTELERVISANPFPKAEAEPKSLHLAFLDAVPSNPDLAKLESLKAGREQFRLVDKVFFLHAPDGVGRSKLAANAERLLGVPATDRNWRTVCTLRDMAKELG